MGPLPMKRFFTYLSIISTYHGCRRRGIKVNVTPFYVVQYSYFILVYYTFTDRPTDGLTDGPTDGGTHSNIEMRRRI